jgi:hypothetical protein
MPKRGFFVASASTRKCERAACKYPGASDPDDARARSELDGAKSLVQSGLNIGYDQWSWPAWVFVRLLLQEADSLIPQAPPLQPSAAPR